MSPDPVQDRIRALAASLTGRDVESIPPDEPIFAGGLDLDSIAVTALIQQVEAAFGVQVADFDLDLASLRTIHTLSRLVASLCEGELG